MKIAVVMSTYNGEKYLSEQIDSILKQRDLEVELFVRDDGSKDRTVDILKQYMAQYSNIHVDFGVNLGFSKSFMTVLRNASGYSYYAFSDQDDYWDDKKLIESCKMIQKVKNALNPVVYYSNLSVSDEKLNVYKKTCLETRRQSLESLVMRRSIAGCTMVFNKAMWLYINSVEVAEDMLRRGHDSFILSLCYALGGTVICDSNSYIKYRQHQNNTSGRSNSVKQRLKKEWNALINKKGTESAIAQSILENWDNDINEEAKKTLQLIVGSKNSLFCRFKILLSRKFTTGDLKLTFLGKFRAIMGLL